MDTNDNSNADNANNAKDKIKDVIRLHEKDRCVINLIKYDTQETDHNNVVKINDVEMPHTRLKSRRYVDEYLNGYVRSTCITENKFSYHDLRTYEIIPDKLYIQVRMQSDPLCVPLIIDYDYTQCYDIITLKQNDGSVEDELTYYDRDFTKIESIIKRKRQTLDSVSMVDNISDGFIY